MASCTFNTAASPRLAPSRSVKLHPIGKSGMLSEWDYLHMELIKTAEMI
jgi:hypothetical protein